MKLKSPHGLSPTGVGPFIYSFAVPFVILGILNPSTYPSNVFLQTIGLLLIIVGISLFIITMRDLIHIFNKGELATTGTFELSRNPLYSCWIVLILPGLALLFLNWWFLVGAISMYIGLNLLIKKEEDDLERVFGQEFLDYKKKVSRVLIII